MFAHLREHAGHRWPRLGRIERRVDKARFHVIDAEALMGSLATETKLAANLQFFTLLRDAGRSHARAWLEQHGAAVGRRSTVDLSALFY